MKKETEFKKLIRCATPAQLTEMKRLAKTTPQLNIDPHEIAHQVLGVESLLRGAKEITWVAAEEEETDSKIRSQQLMDIFNILDTAIEKLQALKGNFGY